jgi:hypothetical protein
MFVYMNVADLKQRLKEILNKLLGWLKAGF